ncbi:hypothetical protein FOCC_FOCC005977 [Frankliniella occidentalis]|uniref:Uncharacterized protein LOC113207921 n=1 Tax=Frankliniella occidentalis TaxID=133901 RepID=A0A6J1SMC9_FRAOC|nr:uncharacterized protein LOC113207921 [Frankliniella occidentalis]KAE8747334.1 hypothetical protein FOCC_FOCC005977 [Frankliniella occidentalis]
MASGAAGAAGAFLAATMAALNSNSASARAAGDKAFLEQLYKELESPFVWGLLPSLGSHRSDSSRWDCHIRRLADVLQVADSPWTRVVLHLNLSWLFFKRGDNRTSRSHLAEADAVLGMAQWSGAEAGLLLRGEEAARHALGAAWAHLAHVCTPLADMQPELVDITPVRRLGPGQRAALYGLQASCLYFLCVQGEKMGKKMVSAARKASGLQPEEGEWLLLMGKRPDAAAAGLEGDAMTPHAAVYTATRHVYCGEWLAARVLLRRALDLWPANVYVQAYVAYLYAGWVQEQLPPAAAHERVAERCSVEAVRLAPGCVLVHAVRRLVRPEHNSPCLSRCSKVYGMGVDEMVTKMRGSCFVLEGIMCGFVSGHKEKRV